MRLVPVAYARTQPEVTDALASGPLQTLTSPMPSSWTSSLKEKNYEKLISVVYKLLCL